MCLSPLWREWLWRCKSQILHKGSYFFKKKKKKNLLKMETWVVTWGWMGWVMLLLRGLGHCDLTRFSCHQFPRSSFIFSHLWWAIKHFMLRKHILGLIKNSYQIAYRCLDGPSNQKELQSHSLSFTGHPQWGRGDLGRGDERVVCFEKSDMELLSAGRVELNSLCLFGTMLASCHGFLFTLWVSAFC